MATLNVGGTQQFVFFGTGGDLLPGTDKTTTYHLLGVQDNGASGAKTFDQVLQKSNSASVTVDEKVTAFPAVAGDIVFFTTTIFNDVSPCTAPTANLYAFTYVGGAAYDNTGDNVVTNQDTAKVKSIAGRPDRRRAVHGLAVEARHCRAAGPHRRCTQTSDRGFRRTPVASGRADVSCNRDRFGTTGWRRVHLRRLRVGEDSISASSPEE